MGGAKALVQEGPASFSNWSGFELRRSILVVGTGPGGGPVRRGDPYDWIHGTWTVPATTGEFITPSYCAVWVGLDGDATPDLVQAGTASNSVRYPPSAAQGFEVDVSSYWAWTQFLPQQQQSQQVNLSVSPGDRVLVEVWMGNAGSAPTLSGSFGVFLIMNLTTGFSTQVLTPVAGSVVSGNEAVWIVERPTLFFPPQGIFGAFSKLSDLADYGSAVMSEAYARLTNSARGRGYVPYYNFRDKQITMTNGSTVLSTVTSLDSYSMRFDWHAFS
jgi:hypothetical protein